MAVAGSMALTGMLGSAAVLIARSRIQGTEGLETTGHFDAAWSISMNQANLVLASMQAYYLPAMARTRSAEERSAQLTQTLRLGAIVGAAVIVAATAVKPALLGALYSSAFEAGARYLRWTLVGDYLKVASWILSVPMLAAADMKLFLASDLAAHGTFILASTALGRWTSWAEATAMAFVLMYVIHLVFCGFAARRRYGIRLDAATAAIWLGGLGAVCGAAAAFWRIA
jgi:PST family polysaccharide transporter